MNDRKFVNQFQPQTLFIATVLLYINAFFAILSFYPPSMLFGAALAAAGFGIANEKRWGYFLAVALTGLEVLLYVAFAGGIIGAISSPVLVPLAFTVALFALLLHPQSRDYQRIWFK